MNKNRFFSVLANFRVTNQILDALTQKMSLPLVPVIGTEERPGFMAECTSCYGGCVGDCEGSCFGCTGSCDGCNR